MKALLLKDWYLLKSYCRSSLFIGLLFLLVSPFTGSFFFIYYPTILASLIPSTLLSYEEREHWMTYCNTMPVSRKTQVTEKYAIGALVSCATILVTAIVLLLQAVFTQEYTLTDAVTFTVVDAILAVVAQAFCLPFLFKFGTEKGSMIYLGCTAGLFGACAAASVILVDNVELNGYTTNRILPIVLILLVLFLLGLKLSHTLSVRFFEAREL